MKSKRIISTSTVSRRIVSTSSMARKVDPELVREALGAEYVGKVPKGSVRVSLHRGKIQTFCEVCGKLAEFFCNDHPEAKLLTAEIIDSSM